MTSEAQPSPDSEAQPEVEAAQPEVEAAQPEVEAAQPEGEAAQPESAAASPGQGADGPAQAQTKQGQRDADRVERCEELIQRHTLGAVGVGLLPIPGLDMAALVALQLNMLRGIGEIYGEPLSESLGRTLIASLIGGIAPLTSVSVLKFIPVVGTLLASVSAPVFTGASSYALGRVFVMHFESGGTFLSLDPDKVRMHYEAEFARGRELLRKETFRKIRP